MRRWFTKLRAILGLGVVGGAAGLTIGGAWTVVDALLAPGTFVAWSDLPLWGLFGAVSGSGFAVLLTGFESRRTLPELPLWRAGVWGGSVSASIPLILGFAWSGSLSLVSVSELLPAAGVCAGLGAALGAGMVAVARRADSRELEERAEAAHHLESETD